MSQNLEAAWSSSVFKELLVLSECTSKKQIIDKISRLDENVLVCLVELVFNVLAGKLTLKPVLKKRLRPYVTHLRTLASIREVPRVRTFLIQKGGALFPALLPVLITCAAEILKYVL